MSRPFSDGGDVAYDRPLTRRRNLTEEGTAPIRRTTHRWPGPAPPRSPNALQDRGGRAYRLKPASKHNDGETAADWRNEREARVLSRTLRRDQGGRITAWPSLCDDSH